MVLKMEEKKQVDENGNPIIDNKDNGKVIEPAVLEGVVNELKDIENLTVYTPRRKNFPINDPNAAEEQIAWEFQHLKEADILFFWFSRGSLNPIVLYELGMWCNSGKKLALIGIDPEYERKQDVIIQTKLARPRAVFFDSLEKMIEEVTYLFTNIFTEEEEE